MKRVTVESWTTKEKLCLASAVLHSGDQNWMSVSRILRQYGELSRPIDFYSQKQCAVQYECLLNNAGTPKRKKRSEKGVETVDTPGEAIVRKLVQERVEELEKLVAEDKADYLRIKKLQEEVDSGKMDDKLDEIQLQLEEDIKRDKERHSVNNLEMRKIESDTLPRLGLIANRNKTLGDSSLDADSNDSTMDVDVKMSPIPTSPLLTSLLQSPSPSLLHRSSSTTPTITSLLHSSPSIPSRVQETPTLPKLLETPSSQSPLPEKGSVTDISKKDSSVVNSATSEREGQPGVVQEDVTNYDVVTEETPKHFEDADNLDSTTEDKEKKPNVVRRLDLEISPRDSEKEEHSSLNHTQDSDTLEEQLESEIELDSQAVDMIVMGPNQSVVIAVHHDLSSEHVEEETSSCVKTENDIEESKDEPCEVVTEEAIVMMNEEEMMKPVEDALKIINDATIVVAESEQVVEIETPTIHDIQGDISNVEEVIESEVKGEVEEEIIVEEVIEEVKDEMQDKNDRDEMNMIMENTKDGLVEEEVVADESSVVLKHEEVVVESEIPTGRDVKEESKDKNKIDEDKKVRKEEKQVEEEKEVERKPKKVGRRRKSSKEGKEKEETKPVSTRKDPPMSPLKESHSSSLSPLRITDPAPSKDSVSSPAKEPHSPVVKHSPIKSQAILLSPKKQEPEKSVMSPKNQEEKKMEVEKVVTPKKHEAEKSVKKPEEEKVTETSLLDKEMLSESIKDAISDPVAGPSKETVLSLPPPENVISEFKVPRSNTPSTTDEDDPIVYIPKRGKSKRNSGVDSKPSSPCPQTFDEGNKDFRAWKKAIMVLYSRLSTHKYASIFLRPITNERARGYHSVIHRPMDLSTLKKNIENGLIRTTVEFQRDVMLMFQNAIMYNNTNTEIFEMACFMQRECILDFQLMVEAMGEGVPWRESALNSEKTTRTRIKTEDTPTRKRAHNSISEDKTPLAVKRKKQGTT